MKKIIITFLIFSCNIMFSQNYLEGKNLYCKSDNPRAMELFNTGIETLHLNKSLDKKYLKMTADVFFRAYQADTTFCDAIFFVGYTKRLLDDKYALTFYYYADSLANNKSIEFKTNLAAEAIRRGNEASFKIARRKYNELIEYFPESPEGYYGFAITSPFFNDTEKGLENINIAIEKYKNVGSGLKSDVVFMKGILLSLNKKYSEGLEYLEKSYSSFKKEENFKIHYSLCLLKVSEINNDDAMRKKALKIYEKIENKEEIPDDLKTLFKF